MRDGTPNRKPLPARRQQEVTMSRKYKVMALTLVSALLAGCSAGDVTGPAHMPGDETPGFSTQVGAALATPHTPAAGTFSQTGTVSLEVRQAGPNTILEQTTQGVASGTLTGDLQDELRVVIHPNGSFNAHFTVTCVCTVEGREGVVELVANNTGEMIGPVGVYEGRAVITGGTGELSGLRGVLQFEGAVDLTTGLSTLAYSGTIHFAP
jgi:hypothetical protein